MGKRKKSKKGRKYKGFDSTTNKRAKDEVTGYWMEVNGQKLVSDTLYGEDEDNGQGPISEFKQYEFEFGEEAIALTFTDGDENLKRYVLLGEFRYDKSGRIKSAVTREFADYTHSPTSEWINVFQREPTTTSPYEIFMGFEGNEVFAYDKQIEEDPILATGTTISGFWEYQSSSYYKPIKGDEWWTNPFASDVVA